MKKHLTMAVLAVFASGCATVGSVKALEKRVNDMEKKVAKVEGTAEAFNEKVDNVNSRLRSLEQAYDVVIEEINKIREARGEKPLRAPK